MMPLIVIGAPTEMQNVLEINSGAGHIVYHPTAEAAYYALLDALQLAHQDEDHPELKLREEGWNVHVAYGPLAYGPLMVGGVATSASKTSRLPHTGRTLVLGWHIDAEPSRARRVQDKTVTGPDPDTTPWQAATAVNADQVVDVASVAGVHFLVSYLSWKSPAPPTRTTVEQS